MTQALSPKEATKPRAHCSPALPRVAAIRRTSTRPPESEPLLSGQIWGLPEFSPTYACVRYLSRLCEYLSTLGWFLSVSTQDTPLILISNPSFNSSHLSSRDTDYSPGECTVLPLQLYRLRISESPESFKVMGSVQCLNPFCHSQWSVSSLMRQDLSPPTAPGGQALLLDRRVLLPDLLVLPLEHTKSLLSFWGAALLGPGYLPASFCSFFWPNILDSLSVISVLNCLISLIAL